MNSIWKEVKAAIKLRLPGHSFRMWVEPLELKKCLQERIILTCPNLFFRKRVLDNYGKLLESEIRRVAGKPCDLTIEVVKGKSVSRPVTDQDLQLPLPNVNVRPHNGRFLRKDFTFDQFVVGGNNDFAYSASLALASRKNSQQNF